MLKHQLSVRLCHQLDAIACQTMASASFHAVSVPDLKPYPKPGPDSCNTMGQLAKKQSMRCIKSMHTGAQLGFMLSLYQICDPIPEVQAA